MDRRTARDGGEMENPATLSFPSPQPQIVDAGVEIDGVIFTAVMEVWPVEHANHCAHPHVLAPNSDGKRVFAWYFINSRGEIVYPSRSIPPAAAAAARNPR